MLRSAGQVAECEGLRSQMRSYLRKMAERAQDGVAAEWHLKGMLQENTISAQHHPRKFSAMIHTLGLFVRHRVKCRGRRVWSCWRRQESVVEAGNGEEQRSGTAFLFLTPHPEGGLCKPSVFVPCLDHKNPKKEAMPWA